MASKKKQPKSTAKPRKSRKPKEIVVDKEISKLSKSLEVVSKIYTANGSSYKIYKDIPRELAIDETTEHGRKVMVAMYPDSHEIYLMGYYKPGMQSYPFGGIKIYNKTLGETRQVYPDAVVKHKDVEYYNRVIADCD
jgi:hypothetical protein